MADFDMESLDVATRYKLMIGSIVPRPIGWISSIDTEGRANLAPYSFFNAVSSTPPMVMFGPSNKADGCEKDSLRNVLPREDGGTGEFVVNIVSEPMLHRMSASAEPLEYGESEFELAGLGMVKSDAVSPPGVEGALVRFECRTEHVLRFAPGEPAGGSMVLGRILRAHIDDALLNERSHVDAGLLQAVGRMGGLEYCTTRDRMQVRAGRAALEGDPEARVHGTGG